MLPPKSPIWGTFKYSLNYLAPHLGGVGGKKNPAEAGFFYCKLGLYMVIESALVHFIDKLSYLVPFLERESM
jgi:hypothetical protein